MTEGRRNNGKPKIHDVTEVNNIILGLNERSDMEAVVLGGAMLDIALEYALAGALKALSNNAKGDVFGDRGPLGTFSSKITMAHALGIVRDELKADLNTIRRIRNEFAHPKAEPTLTRNDIAQWCLGFVTPRNFQQEWARYDFPGFTRPEKPLPSFYPVLILIVDENGNTWVIAHIPEPPEVRPDTAKAQFVEAVQACWIILTGLGYLPYEEEERNCSSPPS